MTPIQLYEAHLMSLILQRDDIVQRLIDVNDQITEFKKSKPIVQ